MNVISGVQVETDETGNFTQISIDLREHEEVIPKLKEMGLLPVMETDFLNEETMTLDEFNKGLEAVISQHYANTR